MTLPPDYQALFEHAVTGEIAPRGQVGVAGRDRASFLQGLLTNDIQALTPGTGCYAAWLTPQGRLITDMHVLESGDMILLDLPAALVDGILQKLDQFLFSEDVQLSDLRGALRAVWVHGPAAAATLQELLGIDGLSGWAPYRNARVTFDSAPAVIARIDELGVPGYCIYLDPAQADAFAAALAQRGVMPASPEALHAARIESGTPIFGIDMDEDTIPLEAGIEARAISFTKGCYVGQEVIIRVLHRGGGRVAKKLVALRVAGAGVAAGAKVFSGEKEIGRVTSAAVSPRFGAVALAYLHRDFLAPGTTVDVDAAGGRIAATVSERPITA